MGARPHHARIDDDERSQREDESSEDELGAKAN